MTCIQVLLPYFLDYVKSAGDRWYNSWKKWICTLRRLCRALQLTVMGHTGQWRVEVLLRSLIFSCPIFFFVWANLFFFLKANEIHIKELSSLLKKKKSFFFLIFWYLPPVYIQHINQFMVYLVEYHDAKWPYLRTISLEEPGML